jgi:hypothetical protein
MKIDFHVDFHRFSATNDKDSGHILVFLPSAASTVASGVAFDRRMARTLRLKTTKTRMEVTWIEACREFQPHEIFRSPQRFPEVPSKPTELFQSFDPFSSRLVSRKFFNLSECFSCRDDCPEVS